MPISKVTELNYKIKAVSEKTGISAHTLRYYEKEGIIPPIKRDKNGIRIFDDCDLSWIEIVCCLKDTNMDLADIKRIVELSNDPNNAKKIQSKIDILENHKKSVIENMEQIKQQLVKIDKKIDFYKYGEKNC